MLYFFNIHLPLFFFNLSDISKILSCLLSAIGIFDFVYHFYPFSRFFQNFKTLLNRRIKKEIILFSNELLYHKTKLLRLNLFFPSNIFQKQKCLKNGVGNNHSKHKH